MRAAFRNEHRWAVYVPSLYKFASDRKGFVDLMHTRKEAREKLRTRGLSSAFKGARVVKVHVFVKEVR